MKKIIIASCIVLFLGIVYCIVNSSPSIASNNQHKYEYYYMEEDNTKAVISLNNDQPKNDLNNISTIPDVDNSTIIQLTTPGSITFLVNKELPLPSDYIPSDLTIPNVYFNFTHMNEKKYLRQEAAKALEELFQAAKEEGLNLCAISGYRSYDRQKEIYENNILKKGFEYTSKYSAQPGHSEHQTGLSIDLSTKSINYKLEEVFAYTNEGKWLAENSWKYGFIIRYPSDKVNITGYSYEPWHIRYVSVDLAQYLTENNLTLEEYFDMESSKPSDNFSYDNLIDTE